MTGIINEQLAVNPEIKKKQNTGNIDVNEPETCVSPVYSLPDEDKLYTQAILACKENVINNIESHSSTQICDKGCFNNNELQIVDLCSDEEDNRFNIGTVDVDVHRAMSSLSIIDIQDQLEMDESQSVLEHFNHVIQPNQTSNTKETKINSIVQNAITKVMNRAEVAQQSLNIRDNFNQNKTQSGTLHNTNVQEKTISLTQNMKNYTLKEKNIIKLNEEVTKPTILKTVKCTPPLSNKSAQAITQISKENVAVDLNAKKPCKKRDDKNKSKEIKTVRRKRKTKQDGDSTQNGNNKLKKSNMGGTKIYNRELKSQNENYKVNISTGINTEIFNNKVSTNVNKKLIQTAIPNIYNKKIEDDLSWVEDIRYVREITTNEFDPEFANVEDSFWDNLNFPNEWDDQDFSY